MINKIMKPLVLAGVCLALTSCTIYTEKQSQALSRAVYATKDSLDQARIDLADYYSQQSTRIVKPPKERINIDPILTPIPDSSSYRVNNFNQQTSEPKKEKRILMVPEKYKNDQVVVVSSSEYEKLLKDKKINDQLTSDYQNLTKFKSEVDEELTRQEQYTNKMIQDLNLMQKQLVEKDLAILKRNIVIVGLVGLMGVGIYLRVKGIL